MQRYEKISFFSERFGTWQTFNLVAITQKGIFEELFIETAGQKEKNAKTLETEGTG